jgi:drug/metabolite transporter (DMT)-like permease
VLIGLMSAFGCALCYGTATVLQAAATRSVQAGSGSGIDAVLLLRAARQWRYLAGLALDGLGFLLQVVALRLVPIYVVGAALAASLAVTALVAAWMLPVRLTSAEWTAVAVVCAGLALLGLAAGPEGSGRGPAGLSWALLCVVTAVLILGGAAGRLPQGLRALALGFGAGSGFAVVEVGVRLLEPINPTNGAFYANPALYAVPAGGAAGFLLLTSALHRGSVTTAVAGMVVGETIPPALIGVVWLGDQTREGFGWMVWMGFAVAIAGTLVLARFGAAPEAQPSPDGASQLSTPHDNGSSDNTEASSG